MYKPERPIRHQQSGMSFYRVKSKRDSSAVLSIGQVDLKPENFAIGLKDLRIEDYGSPSRKWHHGRLGSNKSTDLILNKYGRKS